MAYKKEEFIGLQSETGLASFLFGPFFKNVQGTNIDAFELSHDRWGIVMEVFPNIFKSKEVEESVASLFADDKILPVGTAVSFYGISAKPKIEQSDSSLNLFERKRAEWEKEHLNKTIFSLKQTNFTVKKDRSFVVVSIPRVDILGREIGLNGVAKIASFLKRNLSLLNPVILNEEQYIEMCRSCCGMVDQPVDPDVPLQEKIFPSDVFLQIDEDDTLGIEKGGGRVVNINVLSHKTLPKEITPLGFMDVFGSFGSIELEPFIPLDFFTVITYVKKESYENKNYHATFFIGVLGRDKEQLNSYTEKTIEFMKERGMVLVKEKTVPHMFYLFSLPLQYDPFVYKYLKRETMKVDKGNVHTFVTMIGGKKRGNVVDSSIVFDFVSKSASLEKIDVREMLVSGSSGAGKTFLLEMIIMENLGRKDIQYFSCNEERSILPELFEKKNGFSYRNFSGGEEYSDFIQDISVKADSFFVFDDVEEMEKNLYILPLIEKIRKAGGVCIFSVNTDSMEDGFFDKIDKEMEQSVYLRGEYPPLIISENDLATAHYSFLDTRPGMYAKGIYREKEYLYLGYFIPTHLEYWILTKTAQDVSQLEELAGRAGGHLLSRITQSFLEGEQDFYGAEKQAKEVLKLI